MGKHSFPIFVDASAATPPAPFPFHILARQSRTAEILRCASNLTRDSARGDARGEQMLAFCGCFGGFLFFIYVQQLHGALFCANPAGYTFRRLLPRLAFDHDAEWTGLYARAAAGAFFLVYHIYPVGVLRYGFVRTGPRAFAALHADARLSLSVLVRDMDTRERRGELLVKSLRTRDLARETRHTAHILFYCERFHTGKSSEYI
jgi:hypothetical protein